MAYTVKKLAALSKVSVRTLHFYDEMGLLKPAFYGGNGYRFYEEPQLLLLQQILFYRELGFELKQIKSILDRAGFDKVAALKSHRKVLQKESARIRGLIGTIDKTIEHLNGTQKMKSQELFEGFNAETQAKHEQYLVDRYGDCMTESIAASKQKVKGWTKADWQKSGAAFAEICQGVVVPLKKSLGPESAEAQTVIRRHYEWLKQFWTPNRKSYSGHSDLIVDSDLRKAYEAHHPALPEFAAAAIKIFAERELA